MKPIVPFLLVALVINVARVQAEDQPPATNTVARVNGQAITHSELDTALKGLQLQFAQQGRALPPDQLPHVRQQVLDEMVNRELLLQEGRKKKIADLDAKVDSEVTRVKQQMGGEQQFTNTLHEAGFTLDQYRKQVAENILVQEALRETTASIPEITETEAQQFYNSNHERFKRPQMAHVRHILIRVPSNASVDERKAKRAIIDGLRALLEKGGDFAELAKKNSEDPGSAPKGGDLGTFPPGVMVPEFDAVSFSLEPNKLSDVISTQFGFHLLQVLERTPAGDVEFAEVKDRIRQGLRQQKAGEAARKHVEGLRATAKIELLLDKKP